MALHSLCLFDGYGGFELGLELALGDDVRTVCRVEWEAHAASTLVARMEDQALDPAPVWDDVHTFDGTAWRGRVDLVTAGFPCQPWSSAGQRAGVDDDRWLWPQIARIVAEVGPGLVFLENVPGLNGNGPTGGGLPLVLQDLADLGFDAQWGLHSAADVGAPHKRQRFWLLALANDDDVRRQVLGRVQPGLGSRGVVDRPSGADVGDADGEGRPEVTRGAPRHEAADGRRAHPADLADSAGEDVVDADRRRLEAERQLTGSVGSWVRGDVDRPSGADGVFPPRPDDTDGWERWAAEGRPQPSVRRVPDGATGRVERPAGLADRLHLLGNGLVPQVAASAFLQLLDRHLADADDELRDTPTSG